MVALLKRSVKIVATALLLGLFVLALYLLRLSDGYFSKEAVAWPKLVVTAVTTLLMAGVFSTRRLKSFFYEGWFRIDWMGVLFAAAALVLLIWNPAALSPRGTDTGLTLTALVFWYALLHCVRKTPRGKSE